MDGSFEQNVFLSGAQRELLTQGAAIFMYHKLGPAPKGSRDPFLYTKTEDFNTTQARRNIAAKVIEEGKYCF